MSKPLKKMLIGVGIFFGIVFGWYGAKKIMFFWFMSHYKPPAITVSAAKTAVKTWQPYLSTVGTLHAKQGVEISPEVAGLIDEIHFHSGQIVQQGDLLLVLRDEIEQAALKSNLAKLQLAKMNYEREKTLYNKKVSSQSNLDLRYAELSQAQASVDTVQGQIKQKHIRTPFTGRLGIRMVNVGQFIAPGTPIVTLQSLTPLYVLFNLPERYLPELRIGQEIEISLNLGQEKVVKGKIKAINAKVDAATRNILIQAEVPNDNQEIYPGMYGFVKIWLSQKENVIVVPQTAISYSLSGDYVFVIKDENKAGEHVLHVYRQYVKTGERRDDEVTILEGLKANQDIVTAGQLKLQNGSQILINNDIQL